METGILFPGKNQSPPPSPHSLRLSVSSILCGEESERGGLFFCLEPPHLVTHAAKKEYETLMIRWASNVAMWCLVCVVGLGCAENVVLKTKAPKSNPSFKWERVLKQVTTADGVRFDLLKKKRKRLNQYVAWVGVHGQHRDGWTESKEDKRIAHLINSHNAVVLHNALRLDLPKSPDDVAVGLYRWPEAGFYWGSRYQFDGEWSALRHVAIHDTVNRYQDALLWMGLYDGTRDSPILQFYSAKNLKKELRQAARRFINSERGMSKTATGWAANPIFFRYKDDFLFWSNAENICDWMSKYAKDERLKWLLKQGERCALEQRPANRNLDIATKQIEPSTAPTQSIQTTQE